MLPAAMLVAVIALPLGLLTIVGALLTLSTGTGTSIVRDYPHRFEVHDRWVREHLRRRYLVQHGIVVDPSREAYVPYTPEASDRQTTNRAAAGSPVRIGPVPAAPRWSVDRAASPAGRRSRRTPRASASDRHRRSAPSSRWAHPTRS